MQNRLSVRVTRIVSALTAVGVIAAAVPLTDHFSKVLLPVSEMSMRLILKSRAAPVKSEISTEPRENNPEPTASDEAQSIPDNAVGRVTEQTYGLSAANLTWENIGVSNKTDYALDIAGEYAQTPAVTIADDGPQVLIFHTHATETYVDGDVGYYTDSHKPRTEDTERNMIAVGNAMADALTAAGIGVIHDTALHDKDSYNGAYDASCKAIKSYMEQYPSISIFLDLHRDAITRENGDIIKPTVEIDGKKAAQVMLAIGCGEGNSKFPNWRENLRLGLRIQKAAEDKYPGLMRPIYFTDHKYNEYLANGSLLLEMGSEGNTLEEAVASAKLMAEIITAVMSELKK